MRLLQSSTIPQWHQSPPPFLWTNSPPRDYLQQPHRRQPRTTLSMRIVPCSATQMRAMAPKKVTSEQWQAYWGVNKMERLQKVLESVLVAYGGAWMAWFLSLVSASVGAVISSFAGTALVFNWMYAPYLYARKRNSKIWPSNQRLHYALYIGRIVGLKRIRRRAGKTVGAVAQEYLVMTVADEEERTLEIITQWQESYGRLRPQMRCENLIASPRKDYSDLAMVTETWIPAAGVWVGDYPYLQRPLFRSYVDTALLEDDGRGGVGVSASTAGRSRATGARGVAGMGGGVSGGVGGGYGSRSEWGMESEFGAQSEAGVGMGMGEVGRRSGARERSGSTSRSSSSSSSANRVGGGNVMTREREGERGRERGTEIGSRMGAGASTRGGVGVDGEVTRGGERVAGSRSGSGSSSSSSSSSSVVSSSSRPYADADDDDDALEDVRAWLASTGGDSGGGSSGAKGKGVDDSWEEVVIVEVEVDSVTTVDDAAGAADGAGTGAGTSTSDQAAGRGD